MSSLRVHNIAVVRGDRRIVDGLGFTLGAGEVLHLQGRNGAGKTSVLEVLAGLRQPDDGAIDGRPEPRQQHWLGHKNGLNPALSPVENLEFWAGLNGHRLDAPRAALARVGLKPAQMHRACGMLSTGQRRRAALARLVAATRPWWFLDEPLAGLDVEGLDVFGALLAEHAAGGGAAVVTSHQPLPPELPGLRALRLGS